MTVNANFVNFVYSCLKGDPIFNDLTFVIAHENDIKPTPLEKPIVALSPKGCVIGDKLTQTNDNGEIIVDALFEILHSKKLEKLRACFHLPSLKILLAVIRHRRSL